MKVKMSVAYLFRLIYNKEFGFGGFFYEEVVACGIMKMTVKCKGLSASGKINFTEFRIINLYENQL